VVIDGADVRPDFNWEKQPRLKETAPLRGAPGPQFGSYLLSSGSPGGGFPGSYVPTFPGPIRSRKIPSARDPLTLFSPDAVTVAARRARRTAPGLRITACCKGAVAAVLNPGDGFHFVKAPVRARGRFRRLIVELNPPPFCAGSSLVRIPVLQLALRSRPHFLMFNR